MPLVARHALTFLAGFLMRPCCSIPAALALLGLGGAGVAAALEPYRPWFLLLAVVTFSISFYLNFIRNRNRVGMVVWALSAVFAGALLLGPELIARDAIPEQPRGDTAMSDLQSVNVPVNGMACSACARRLEGVLVQMPGVSEASVSFDEKRAHVSYDPHQTSTQEIAERIRKAGFAVAAG